MRKLSLLLVALLGWGTTAPVQGQESVGGILYSRYRQFRIPFQVGQPRLKQLQLYVSSDQGKTWQPSATAPPDQGHFRFLSDRDGLFWFAVQTLDVDNRPYPATMDNALPSLKVIVDTQPPILNLQPLTPRAGQVGVGWDIRDE